MYYILALILLGVVSYSAIGGAREYKIFQKLKKTAHRQHYYRKWLIESWVLFAGVAIAILVALGKQEYLLHPLIYTNVNSLIPGLIKSDQAQLQSFYAGAGVGLMVAIAVTIIRSWKAVKRKFATAGDVEALLPRNSSERILGFYTAVTAGITEELFFRAALPVVLFGIIGNAMACIVASVIIFGLVHFYQGWKGVLGTLVMGGILMKAFMLSGNIVVPIAIHTFIDLWGLLIIPYVADRSAMAAKRRS